MKPLEFIVNADDLGWSKEVNEAIFLEMERGHVTSASIMANGNAFEDAIAGASSLAMRCSFGVHLNLTAGYPVTREMAIPGVLDGAGKLSYRLATELPGLSRARAFSRELQAQVKRVTDAGIAVSHLDSHHHVHCKPWLTPVFKHVQRRTGIPRIRLSENIFPPPKNGDAILLAKKRLFNSVIRHFPRSGTTDWFADFGKYYCCLESGVAPAEGRIELMTHPGARGPQYQVEAQLLNTDWLALARRPARLITYREI